MKKLSLLLAVFAFIGLQVVFAQTREISGNVTSSEDGGSIPGVSVVAKGTTVGTITDMDGNFTLKVPQSATALQLSFVGMTNKEVQLTSSPSYKIVMDPENINVGEVVVTAMGISKSEKSLGYVTTKVESEDLVRAKDPNVLNSLAGKVAGLNITQQSGSVGASSKVILRGTTSLGGSSQPLFIVDGMPINNDYFANREGITGAVDYGNAAADLNSMDIESVNVLKGAAATALYGSRAKNGAIVITTKRGKAGKVNVSYNGSVRFDEVAKLPDYQNEYAQGLYGEYNLSNFNGWGPKIADVQDQKFEDFLGEQVTLQAHPDNVRDFFDTGLTSINNVDVSGGDEKSDFRISYTNTLQQGIVPQSDYKKNDISFNTSRNFTKKFSVRLTGTYSRGVRDGLVAQGSNDPNVLVSSILGMPRTTDVAKLRENTYDELGNQIPWDGRVGKTNNPYYILDNNRITSDNERFFGNAALNLKLTDWLNIKNQTGIDFATQDRRTIWSVGTIGEAQGKWSSDVYRTRVINNDFLVTANKKFNDFTVNALVGHNIYQREYDRKSNVASDLVVPGLYTWSNAKIHTPTNYSSIKRIHGVFGEVTVDYDNFLFLTVTGRNDFSSTLPKENNSYFYPSVSLGYIFTENFTTPDWFDFGKLRLNWANVGSDEDPYQLAFAYDARSTWYSQYGAGGTFPFGGITGFSIPRTYPNSNLKPQNQTSYEVGLDLRFFGGRVLLDATYYHIDTKDQIVGIDVPLSTGFFVKKINAGMVRNRGVEVELGVTPVKTNKVQWDARFVFAKNVNTVEELTDGLPKYNLTSGWSGLQIQAEIGEPISLFGTAWKRTEDGQYIINKDTGLREIVPEQNLGKVDPDFTLGITNTVSVGNVTFNAVIDWRQGGSMYSGTAADMRSSGLAAETAVNRETPIVDQGVNEIINGDQVTYVPNETPVKSMQDYWGHISKTSNTEGNVYDATYMKLREVSLTYRLPSRFLPTNFISGLVVGIEGRNLWNIIDNVPHVDPELNFFGPGEIGGGVEFNSVPMTRSLGFNLKVNF